ncbi:MAG: hypothetical protein K2X55_21665 [Burkholderiaceae bacterium]|nr:hypothetical protein [Burkholderiaceae bacterium]
MTRTTFPPLRGTRRARTALALAIAVAATGCSVAPSYLDREKIKTVDRDSQPLMKDRVVEESAKMAALQAELFRKLEQTQAASVRPAEPVFNPLDAVNVSIVADATDVRLVFKAIAEQAKLNLVLPASLTEQPRTLSLTLRNLPASQVFDHVIKALDLHGTVERGVIIVRDHQERTFNLDFLQTAMSANFVAGGDVFGANQSSGNQGSGGDSSSTGIRNSFNIRGRNTNDADPFDPIENLLKTIFAVEGDGMVAKGEQREERLAKTAGGRKGQHFVLNKSTGTLYVQGRPSQVATVASLVEQYRNVLSRQVLIEAQILDVALNDDFKYGIDWSALRNMTAMHFGANPLTLGAIESTVPGAASSARTITIPASVLGNTGTQQLGVAMQRGSQSIALNMLKTFGAVHVLSNPSLRVKNTQPAVVSVGSNERYIAQTTSNVSNSGGGQSTVSSNVVTGNLFDGVMLGVIPFIGDDGTISLMINPVQTTVQPGSTNLIDVGSVANPLKISLPKVDFKGLTTSLSLRNGDMVILGGLIDETGNRAKAGLPGLAEVPVIGEMAGAVDRRSTARELILILRVRTL